MMTMSMRINSPMAPASAVRGASRIHATSHTRAAVLVEPETFVIEDVPLSDLSPGSVRVQLQGCGVCASNLSPWEGRPWFDYPLRPGHPGHEAWGLVQEVGPEVAELEVGDRVALISDCAFATHEDVDQSRVVVLPSALDGRPFPGEPLACAFNAFARCGVEPGQRVAVIGIGFMGAVLVALCRAAGAHVMALSRRESSLRAAERMGAHSLVRMDDHARVIREVEQLTGGELCDCVIECAGAQWPLDLAAILTKVRGRLVIAGYHQDGPRQVDMQLWNWRGIDVVNAHERDRAVYIQGMRDAVAAVASGLLDPSPLYTHSFPLARLDDALNATRDRPEGFMKALVTMP